MANTLSLEKQWNRNPKKGARPETGERRVELCCAGGREHGAKARGRTAKAEPARWRAGGSRAK
eukprot:4691537-Pleurochrysis_carterae.AAC.5